MMENLWSSSNSNICCIASWQIAWHFQEVHMEKWPSVNLFLANGREYHFCILMQFVWNFGTPCTGSTAKNTVSFCFVLYFALTCISSIDSSFNTDEKQNSYSTKCFKNKEDFNIKFQWFFVQREMEGKRNPFSHCSLVTAHYLCQWSAEAAWREQW